MSVAIGVSLASALTAVIAVVLSMRQVRLMARQSLLPVVLEAFREARSPEWFEARDFIYERLPAEFSPDRGVSQQPPEARGALRKVGFLFDNFGLLIAHGVVPEELVIGFFGRSLQEEFWQIMAPYIRKEAELRGQSYMIFFEDLVARAQSSSVADIREDLGLRTVDRD
ncbi:hypothetical protein [Streptomyces spectabilis]|uniref:DUF4760 domain-containing protein n=1 Tax=Streptomyces spectabilis TaxID=68270 RepID=A0A516R1R9_STRST|nr:hypothetical protein [Streptomyces spectabilis]QDQ09606.1 hypothetical protein FH965_02725 [Streptomyces spectabilis]